MKDFWGREFEPIEMERLIKMLNERNAKFRINEILGTKQVVFLSDSGVDIGDAICHAGSYGHENGLIEIMGLDITVEEYGDSVLGYLTAEEVLEHLDNALRKDVE